jgi:ribonuclease HII
MLLKPREDCIEFGLDEVGRGCLFGPVCVCCVYIPPNHEFPEYIKLRDSKKTTPKQRQIIMDYVNENKDIIYTISMFDNNQIDKYNILGATMKAMHSAINKMPLIPDHLKVDGNTFEVYMNRNGDFVPHECITKGDDKYTHISLAANIAKFTRDQYILDLCRINPWLDETYKLSGNKGYGSRIHMDAVKSVGITELHRLSFNPCKTAKRHINYGKIKYISEKKTENIFHNINNK